MARPRLPGRLLSLFRSVGIGVGALVLLVGLALWSAAFIFFWLVVFLGFAALIGWLGTKLRRNRFATGAWLALAVIGFGFVTQSYLIDAFRVIDSGTVFFVAVPVITFLAACVAGGVSWLRKRSIHSGLRTLALALLVFDFAATAFLAAAAPF